MTLGIKVVYLKKKEKKKSDGKENPYEKCLYSYANKELKSCGPSCRG